MSLDFEQLFESPIALLSWAYEDTLELQNSIAAVLDEKAYEEFTEVDPESGYLAHKVRLTKSFPAEWRKLASHALHDIRHAADQAFSIACQALSPTPIKEDLYFPWARDPRDLEFRLAARAKKGAPEAIFPAIRACEPYPRGDGYTGGDDHVFHLRNLAGNSKHRITLQPGTGVQGHSFKGHVKGDFLIPYNGWNPAKNEFTIILTEPGVERDYEIQITFCVAFSEVEALRRQPATTMLAHFGDYVGFVCETLFDQVSEVRQPPVASH